MSHRERADTGIRIDQENVRKWVEQYPDEGDRFSPRFQAAVESERIVLENVRRDWNREFGNNDIVKVDDNDLYIIVETARELFSRNVDEAIFDMLSGKL